MYSDTNGWVLTWGQNHPSSVLARTTIEWKLLIGSFDYPTLLTLWHRISLCHEMVSSPETAVKGTGMKGGRREILDSVSTTKNSSTELAVIWGNFGFSDSGCFDLGCSDLACSDWAYSDWACFDLACSNLGHFFIKILTFLLTQYSQLGNLFCTHPNGTNSTKWNFCTLFHNNIHILTKRSAQYPFLNFLSKNDISTLTLALPKNQIKIFKNQKSNTTTQTPIQQTIFY